MTGIEFGAIFHEHKNAIYQFVWRMTNSVSIAEDITQEVFLALLKGEAQWDRSRGPMRALLLGIARHLAWKRWRTDQRWSSLDEEVQLAATADAELPDLERAVASAVAALPPLQRESLILATYEGLSLREMAETLGVEVATVKARLYRGRENLKRMLASCKSGDVRSTNQNGTS